MSPRLRFSAIDITRYYILALLIVGSLAAGSHLLQQSAIENQQGIGAVINLSGRQRMLSQRISSLAAQYRLGDPSALPALIDATNHLESEYNHLSQDPSLHALYFDGHNSLDSQVRTYITTARQIAALPADSPAQAPLLSALFAQSRAPLLDNLNHIVALHQAEAEARVHDLRLIQTSVLTIMLLTLVLEAFLIFRPMVRKIVTYNAEIIHLATTDSLTGALNRREFFARARTECERVHAEAIPLTVLMLDIDHFKNINDTFGHAAGDTALSSFCTSVRQHLRATDVLGRLGGEEFAILAPETTLDDAILLAERLRLDIAEARYPHDSAVLDFTVSIGIAQLHPDDATIDRTLELADQRLYSAKAAGRNRIAA